MADAAKVALTGLAGVLAGITEAADRKLKKEKEAHEKKGREIEMRLLNEQVRELQMKNQLTQAADIVKRQELRSKEQELRETRSVQNRLMRHGPLTETNQPIQPLPQGVQGPQPSQGMVRNPVPRHQAAIYMDPKVVDQVYGPQAKPMTGLQSTQAKVLEGAMQGQQGQAGAPLVTGAKVGGVDLEFPGPTAQMEGIKTRAREQAKPLSTAVQTPLSALLDVQSDLNKVAKNFDPSFVGKGFQGSVGGLTSGVRGFTGQMSAKETQMRQALDRAKDSLLRAKSGAQINEQEYARLSKLFPDAGMLGDEPLRFMALLFGAMDSVNKTIATKKQLATTPSGKMVPKILKIERIK